MPRTSLPGAFSRARVSRGYKHCRLGWTGWNGWKRAPAMKSWCSCVVTQPFISAGHSSRRRHRGQRIAMRNGTTGPRSGRAWTTKSMPLRTTASTCTSALVLDGGKRHRQLCCGLERPAWTNLGEGMNALVTSLTHARDQSLRGGLVQQGRRRRPPTRFAKWNGINGPNLAMVLGASSTP
jgi:hypothetical protein